MRGARLGVSIAVSTVRAVEINVRMHQTCMGQVGMERLRLLTAFRSPGLNPGGLNPEHPTVAIADHSPNFAN